MSVKIEISPELEKRIDTIIEDVRQKQDEQKIELYNQEMEELIKKHGELGLLACGCQIIKSSWKGYIILPPKYIEDAFIPALKTKMAIILTKNEAK